MLKLIISFAISVITVLLITYYYYGKRLLLTKLKKMWALLLGLCIPYYFIIDSISQSNDTFGSWMKYFPSHIEFGKDYSNLPNYLVFFATLLSVFLIYSTFQSQRKATQIAEFENRFFKFIDYHRENVNELEYRDPKTNGERYWKGNQVFTVIFYEIRDLLNSLNTLQTFQNLEQKKAAINLIYQCVFFGATNDGLQILQSKFLPYRFWAEIDFEHRLAAYSATSPKIVDGKFKYYSGHVRRLGHYFRNIYQAVRYVDKQDFLTEKEKYDYVTILRAQMSVYEQAVFFYNSLSELGDVWEWKWMKYNYPKKTKEKKYLFQKLLITKYDFIRNSLNRDGVISDGISIKDFYPLLTIERQNEIDKLEALPFNNGENITKICRLCFNEKYIGYKTNEDMKYEMRYRIEIAPKSSNEVECNEPNCATKKFIGS